MWCLVSKASVTPEVSAEDVLRHLVVSLGKAAEQRGIQDDDDLDALVESVQERVYQEGYGG